MKPSIGVAATFRDEVNALPGFLESASRFFDDILLVDCGPGKVRSTDGSLDIIRKWGLPDPMVWDLNDGFGRFRTQLYHTSKTDWTVILDIDERMQVLASAITCQGSDRYPDVEKPALTVTTVHPAYNHRQTLIDKIRVAEATGAKAIRFQRRHWFDFSNTRPCQNFTTIKDYQLRCMKSRANVGYKRNIRMHEQAWDFVTLAPPKFVADDDLFGPFIDHYHCWFKPMEPEQRKEDIANYDLLHKSDTHTPITKR